MKRVMISLLCILGVLFLSGCRHSSSDDGTAEAVALSGTTACPDVSGVVELSFDAASDSTVTGTVAIDGTTYTVTGTYDAETGEIIASYADVGVELILSGTYLAGSGFAGDLSITDESGETVCTISAQVDEEEDPVENYLGTYGFDLADSGAGTWNMSVKNGVATGTYASTSGLTMGLFQGTVSDSGITVDDFYAYNSGTHAYYHMSDWGWATHAEGTFSGSTLAGTWYWDEEDSDDDDVNGEFTGTLQ